MFQINVVAFLHCIGINLHSEVWLTCIGGVLHKQPDLKFFFCDFLLLSSFCFSPVLHYSARLGEV